MTANVKDEAYSHGLLQQLAGRSVFTIAHSGNEWLGFIPETGEFFLAYGESADHLTALGFHSDDALAQWLG
ncbi:MULTISPECIES: hypothetical protein [unclassified Lysobacter]|uniref:hypothetical protein n=1 Tax=unclassified Lysobacter TaxID=2635362 RepID=UPI000B070B59|nr:MULTISPECIES: hypothetical protein [unclassified Lysobacter]